MTKLQQFHALHAFAKSRGMYCDKRWHNFTYYVANVRLSSTYVSFSRGRLRMFTGNPEHLARVLNHTDANSYSYKNAARILLPVFLDRLERVDSGRSTYAFTAKV